MEDRYEIREKIGQGGLGSVYRAYDTRMKRDVAIKRISGDDDDKELLQEATRQLIKEAGSLASLQHPHIVTIYDVGSDEDGPFVVMELITGKTLDELVERAPLTWPDFRELAMQSQEALIAAQELELVHRDLKPGNVMLNWLPSGKFQVKIVDFGLAKLTPKPSLQTLDQSDSVFGSIFFMAPEQFERKPLDFRTDMYAIGCVYYHALTGAYPFDGETGPQVMAAHLQHQVAPIREVRPEIPLWACDWIMWHINRHPDDRPPSARDALHIFLQNDAIPNPPMSLGMPAPAAEAPKRARLIIPGAAPEPEAPQAEPSGPRVVMKGSPAPLYETAPVKTQTAAQADSSRDGSRPGIHSAPQNIHQAATQSVRVATPVPTGPLPLPAAATGGLTAGPPPPAASAPSITRHMPIGKTTKKAGLNNAAKTTLAGVLGLLVVFLAVFLLKRNEENKKTEIYNSQISEAAKGDATEVLFNSASLDFMLEAAANVGANEERQTIYKALYLAKATDGTDVDARIAEFATTRPMIPDVREVLIRDVLRQRKNPAIVPILMKFAASTEDVRAATAALQASQFMVGDEDFDAFLRVVQFTPHIPIRQAAEGAIGQIIQKSRNREALADRLATTYQGSVDDDVRHSLLRLLGRAGGGRALDLVKASLADPEQKNQIAALVALSSWADGNGYPLLMDYLSNITNEQLRARAFDSAHRYASASDAARDSATEEALWTQLASNAKSSEEQIKTLQALATKEYPWSLALAKKFEDPEGSDRVINLAEDVVARLTDRLRVKEVDSSGPVEDGQEE